MAIGMNLEMLLNAWNIRFMMILSLGVQIFLAYASPYRKNTSRSLTTIMVWSAYLLTDWAAIYAFGLISNTVRVSAEIPSQVNQNILALWASFLLIHLGGPDTITAYSLEDNSLWLRHLLRLVGQLAVYFYIFVRTFPGNNLVAPTVLVLTTGVVKSGDKTRALFLASLDNLKSSIAKQSKVEVLLENRRHNYFFERFRGMIVDILPSLSEIEESRKFFKNKGANEALIVISEELNLMYEVLYSKILAIYSLWGQLSRCLFYVGMVAALVLFILSSKDQFDRVDVRITYCLLVGVFIVDTSQTAMLLGSDLADFDVDLGEFSYFVFVVVFVVITILTYVPTLTLFMFFRCFSGMNEKLWSESMGAFNLLDCSIRKYCRRSRKKQDSVTRFCLHVLGQITAGCGLTDGLDNIMHMRRNDFNNELWKFIFDELEQKASNIDNEEQAREAYESKGELVLMKNNLSDMKKSYVEDFEYDKGVLCWHIATEICYNIDENDEESDREWSKILSDYLMYILIHRPKLTATIVGIGHERYTRTCFEVKDLANRLGVENLKEFCVKVIEGRAKDEGAHDHENVEGGNYCRCGVEDKSVLREGCDLARILVNYDNKWKIIAGVWVEMLSYAAGHCRGEAHAQAVSEGGELLSHVWFLMAHFGISARWQKTDRCEHKRPVIL